MEGRVDPRVARSKACILAAAARALQEEGAAGVTMEGVAERAGVAKTTVYRLWAGRSELLLAAFEQLSAAPELADTGDLRADLVRHAVALNAALQHEAWPRSLPALVDVAERDAKVDELARELAARRRQRLLARLTTAVHRGELPAGTDLELLVAALVGPLFYRRFFVRVPTSAAQAEHLVDSVLVAIRPG